jgi:hypothetical protein
MNRIVDFPRVQLTERDETEMQIKWLDSLPIGEYADLARGFIETHHDVQDAFLRDTYRTYLMARKFGSEA